MYVLTELNILPNRSNVKTECCKKFERIGFTCLRDFSPEALFCQCASGNVNKSWWILGAVFNEGSFAVFHLVETALGAVAKDGGENLEKGAGEIS
jgi:hypothetical protein